jgi:hypothetical protein
MKNWKKKKTKKIGVWNDEKNKEKGTKMMDDKMLQGKIIHMRKK